MYKRQVKGWDTGGVYTWSGNMLGEKWGFANIFFQWFQITVGFVTMIYFILGALSYVLHWDALNNNPAIKFIGVLVIFWALTFSQFKGTKLTAKISKIGFIFGIMIPAIVLFALAIGFFTTGGKSLVPIDAKALIPDFTKLNTLVVFVSDVYKRQLLVYFGSAGKRDPYFIFRGCAAPRYGHDT